MRIATSEGFKNKTGTPIANFAKRTQIGQKRRLELQN
jgi:hypothetical protein